MNRRSKRHGPLFLGGALLYALTLFPLAPAHAQDDPPADAPPADTAPADPPAPDTVPEETTPAPDAAPDTPAEPPAPVGDVPSDLLSLMGRLPENTLFVATTDTGEDNPSIRHARKRPGESPEDDRIWASVERDFREGISRWLRLFGQKADLYESLRSALGTRGLVAVLPNADKKKAPHMLLLATVRDREGLENRLHDLIASAARNATEVVTTEGDNRVHTWSGFYGSKFTLTYIVGADVAAISTDAEQLNAALARSNTPPSWTSRLLASVPRGILNAYISPSVTEFLPARGEEGPKPSDIGFDGQAFSVSLSEEGMTFTETTLVGKEGMIPSMLAGAGNIPAISDAAFSHIPEDSLAALTVSAPSQWIKAVSSLSMLAPFFMEEEGKPNELIQTMTTLFDGDVTLGLRAVLPVPSGIVTVKSETAEGATKKLETVAGIAEGMKIETSPSTFPDGRRVTVYKVGKEPFSSVMVEAQGDTLVASTDRRTLEEASALVDGTGSLSESRVFQNVRRNLGREPRLLLYADLRALSGTGMMLSHLYFPGSPVGRALARGFEKVEGMGMGVEIGTDRLTSRVFLSGDPSQLLPAMAGGTIAILPAVGLFGYRQIETMGEQGRTAQCTSHMKQLATAMMMYAQDHDEHFPRANAWQKALTPYVKDTSVFRCPSDHLGEGSSYAMNLKLSGVSLAQVENPAETVLFYESNADGTELHGIGEDVDYRHNGQFNVAYVDANVKTESSTDIEKFRLKKTMSYGETAQPQARVPSSKNGNRRVAASAVR